MEAVGASKRPTWPVKRVLTATEVRALRPEELVRSCGFVFAKLRDGWALVDAPVDDLFLDAA